MREGLLDRDVAGRAADDDGQFGLIVHLWTVLAGRRQDDRVAGADNGGGRLHEHDRLVRDRRARLGGVGAVVQTDAKDVARLDRRQQASDWRGLAGRCPVAKGMRWQHGRRGVVDRGAVERAVVGGREADESHGIAG